jgi:hypothetical protein
LLVLDASGCFVKIKRYTVIGFLGVLVTHCDQGSRGAAMAGFVRVSRMPMVILPSKHLQWTSASGANCGIGDEIIVATPKCALHSRRYQFDDFGAGLSYALQRVIISPLSC